MLARKGASRASAAFPRHQAAIFLQLSAHRRHISAHSFISPIRSQSAAHRSQISLHKRQVRLCSSEPMTMKCADVLHISAHAIIKLKCFCSVCCPPASKQWPWLSIGTFGNNSNTRRYNVSCRHRCPAYAFSPGSAASASAKVLRERQFCALVPAAMVCSQMSK
jgi:hypothetical protein